MNLEIDYLWSHKCPKKWDQYTLIALVITIIVLLILAGVTIATLTGDNGLLTKAGQAKNASSDAEIEEQIKLAIVESQTSKHLNTGKSELENIEESLSKTFKETVTVEKMGKGYKIRIGNTKTTYRMKTDGTVYKYEEMDPTSIYAKLDEYGTLYLRSTQNDEYVECTASKIIQSNYDYPAYAIPSEVLKVVIEEPIAPEGSCIRMFYNCANLTEIENIENFHTENVSGMGDMFANCYKLTEIDVSKFDTSKVTDMSYMFASCNKITEVDISNFDTNQVTKMTGMFLSSGIKQIDVSNFDTSKVTAMAGMFYSMPLTQLDISNFNTNLVTNMRQLFQYCNKLEYLNLGENFVINENTDIGQMFTGISNNIRITAIPSTRAKILEKYPNLENNFE